jgi:hypothetical protein
MEKEWEEQYTKRLGLGRLLEKEYGFSIPRPLLPLFHTLRTDVPDVGEAMSPMSVLRLWKRFGGGCGREEREGVEESF